MSVQVKSVDSISRNDRTEKNRFSCKFSDPRSFVVIFTIVGNLELAFYFYLISVLSTLQNRFSFSSKTTVCILLCSHISSGLVAPFIGFLGGRYNRPHLLGIGIILVSISSIMFTIPYFVFGPSGHLSPLSTSNLTKFDICDKNVELTDNCIDDPLQRISAVIPVLLLCLASVVYGIGRCSYNVLGVPYLDDSVDKEKFPVYIGMSVAMRFVGPVIGYGLGCVCLLFSENPFNGTQILKTDPRFIGSWWPGFILLAILLFLSSIPLFFFPRRFKHSKSRKSTFLNPPTIDCRAFGGFCSKAKRVLRNVALLLKTFGATLSILSLGYIIHSYKYLKAQFRKSQSEVNFFSGMLTLFPMGFGMFFGGYLISKYKPKPKWLLVIMFFVGVLASKAILANMFFQCPPSTIQENLESLIVDNYYLTTSCNADCNCNQRTFQPVCASDGSTEFFSACQAGCTRIERTHKPECQCLGGGSAVSGLCAIDCSESFYSFFFVCFVFGIINSVLNAGDTLVSIRCVLPEDKTFAFGFMQTFFSIFGWLPVPLIYDAISDYSCTVSSTNCVETNDCWIYDTNKYRFLLHGVTYFLSILAALCNLGVLCSLKKLENFYSDNKLQEAHYTFGVQLKRLPRIEDETD